MSYGTCVKIGVLLILFAALFSNLTLFKDVAAYCKSGKIYGISDYEKRFEGIRKYLPQRGVVGYISGAGVKDIRFAGQETAKYYLTQYAVAPTIVEYAAARDLVIGNFEPGASSSGVIHEKRLTVIKDFGNGVMLLKGAKK